MNPMNGFAKAHYGYILKYYDRDMANAARFLSDGINSGAEGTTNGLLFYHLGDALQLLGRNEEVFMRLCKLN